MSGDVDHKVACYNAHRVLIKQGKNPWPYEVHGLKAFNETWNDSSKGLEDARAWAKGVSGCIYRCIPAEMLDYNLAGGSDASFIEQLEFLRDDYGSDDYTNLDVDIEEIFNYFLNALYDWADYHRVWID